MRRCEVSGVTFGVEASSPGRDGVGAENVGCLTPDAGDEVPTIAGFLGVINAGADGLEGGSVGDFSKDDLLPKVGGGERASKFGLRGTRGRGEPGRDCGGNVGGGSVVERVGWVPAGVLTVRGRGASCSEEGLLTCVDVTCSTCCTYRLSAVDGMLARS